MARHPSSIPMIEFLRGRIYLGSYNHAPDDNDDFVFFTVEDSLPYNAFHLDFGPLHMGHLYRFAVVLHNILNDDSNQGKAIVLYSSSSPQARANATCLLCCYMVLIQSWSPHQVLQPISQIEPPLMPFRDAGYSAADFEITIQDIVYGVWRAKERGMLDLTNFNLEEFEQYERVDQGDLNIVSKDFIAFASPQQSKPGMPLNEPFKKVLGFFKKHDVKMVVRLNSHLYDSNEFTKRGIQHIDMIFDDGTCPTMEFVQNFIGVSEGVIAEGGKIAVHCKAGLGRTGCLIGAHLIYTHGFTANECIGYMRMIRPGMVVGPQQHWLYLHQNDFRNWKFTMILDTLPIAKLGGYCSLISYEAYKTKQRKAHGRTFSPMINSRRRVSGRMKNSLNTAVPITSPGQPRKGNNGRYVSNSFVTNSDEENNDNVAGNVANDEEEEEDQEADILLSKENGYNKVQTITVKKSPKVYHQIDNSLEETIHTTATKKQSFKVRDDNEKDDSETPRSKPSSTKQERTPTISGAERRRRSPQSSWRVLRSITSPNSNKSPPPQPSATSSSSSSVVSGKISPVLSSTPAHYTRSVTGKAVKDNLKEQDSIEVAKTRSRSGARVRHRIVSQTSVNEKVVSTGAIQKVSQRRKRS